MDEEQWRHQCEVRTYLRWAADKGFEHVRRHLELVAQKRGQAAADRLRADMNEQWRLGNRGHHNDWRSTRVELNQQKEVA